MELAYQNEFRICAPMLDPATIQPFLN